MAQGCCEPLSTVVATGSGGERLCFRPARDLTLELPNGTKDLIYACFTESRAINAARSRCFFRKLRVNSAVGRDSARPREQGLPVQHAGHACWSRTVVRLL